MINMRHTVHVRGAETVLSALGSPRRTAASMSPKAKARVSEIMANMPGGGNVQNSQVFSYLGNTGQQYDLLLSGLVSDDDSVNYRFYRDIYRYDAVAGPCVDIRCILPFSDFTLVGSNPERLKVYNSAVERLELRSMFPRISHEYLVTGKFIGSLLYDRQQKGFSELMLHKAEDAIIKPLPFAGVEPSIKVKQSDSVRNLLTSDDPRVERFVASLNPQFVEALSADSMILDAPTTLWLPRVLEASTLSGTSYLKRILPLYLIDKSLYRGTVIEAQRRQRSLLHLAVGDEEWEPTSDELQAVVSLFEQADLDPLGAIVATRNGVTPSELRQGGDFWKWTDMSDLLTPIKLRALGISEAFLSGDSTYNNMEASISILLEELQNQRDMLTEQVFYKKILPLVAISNGFFKTGETGPSGDTLYKRMADTTKYDMPKVRWKKPLKPEGDKDFFEILEKMEEKGIPVGLRVWAATAGLEVEDLVKGIEEEENLRERVKKVKDLLVPPSEEGASDVDDEVEFASTTPHKNFLKRKYPSAMMEIAGATKTGKKKYLPNQRAANSQMNRIGAEVLKRLSKSRL